MIFNIQKVKRHCEVIVFCKKNPSLTKGLPPLSIFLLRSVVFSDIIRPCSLYLDWLLMSLFHVYCLCLSSFNLYYLSPPSCLSASAHVHSHLSLPSLSSPLFLFPSLLPLQTMWPPSHYTSWIIEVKPSTPLLPNKSQAFSPPLFPLPLPSLLSLLMVLFNFDLWQQIRSQVCGGNMRFSFFPPGLLELILRNFSHCNPEAHACLVTAGGRVLEDRLSAHAHSYITIPCWSGAQLDLWFDGFGSMLLHAVH